MLKKQPKNYGQNYIAPKKGDIATEFAINAANYQDATFEYFSERFKEYHQNSKLRYDLYFDDENAYIFRVFDDLGKTFVKNFLSDVYDDTGDVMKVVYSKPTWLHEVAENEHEKFGWYEVTPF